MAECASIACDVCNPNTAWKLMDRIEKQTGVPIVQADVSSIAYEIFDKNDDGIRFTGTLNIGSVIFDSPVTNDPDWTLSIGGYNFKTIWTNASPSGVPPAGRTYRYKIFFTCVDGTTFYLIRDRNAREPGGYL